MNFKISSTKYCFQANIHVERSRSRNFNKSTPKILPPKYNRKESIGNHVRGSLNSSHSRRRSIINSTPLPSSSAQENITLCFDQATQTEGTYLQTPVTKIEEVEAVLKNLYSRFQSLVSQINLNSNGSTSMSESEHNDEASYVEPNIGDSWIEPNNTEYVEQVNVITAEIVEDIGAEEVIDEHGGDQHVNSSIVKVEEKVNPNTLRVRRMSAQTTNNIETVTSNNSDLVFFIYFIML